MKNQANNTENLHDILDSFSYAMLVTEHYKEDGLNARPMTVVDVSADGELTLLTGMDTQKVDELLRRPRVDVTFQDGMRFASVGGTARIESDTDALREHWKTSYDAWIPKGAEDPKVALIKIKPDRGEYWDYKARTFFEMAIDKAASVFTQKDFDADAHVHGEVHYSSDRPS